MTYLEQLLDHCASLKLVLNPPHPGAFIQGRTDQARILLAELEQEISKIERQDAPTFELISLQGKEGEWVGFEPYVDTKWQDWLDTMEAESRAFEDELIASFGITNSERGIE